MGYVCPGRKKMDKLVQNEEKNKGKSEKESI
jgi:hypothetical protein